MNLTNSFRSSRLVLVALTCCLVLASSVSITAKPFVDKIPPDTKVIADIEYVSGGAPYQTLDLYLPKTNADKIPLVVFVHGGGWNSGTNKDWHPSFSDLLQNGFAVATINYRMVQQAVWPAQIFDTKASVRFLRAHAADYHLDPDHIGIWGHSAGGHLAAMMGTTNGNAALEGNVGTTGVSSDVQAACDWSGPTDLVATYDDPAEASSILRKLDVGLVGGETKETRDLLKQASPVTYVSAKSAPILIMHGAIDNVVPLSQPHALDDVLQKAGVESKLVLAPGEGHGIDKPADLKPVTEFFTKHLKPTP